MAYCVYKPTYKTTWGETRIYIGYTGSAEWRKVWHEVKANAWNRHRQADSNLEWKVLESAVATKPLALALEAFHAARAVAAEPRVARGGPYARPTLKKEWLQEARQVSGMTMASMTAYGEANPEGPLGLHLRDLSFTRASGSGRRGVTVQRKSLRQSGPSGVNGYISRRSQMDRCVLKRPSAHERRLHRGMDAKAARRKEWAKHLKQRLAKKRAKKRSA
jgi:hypothetical protein